LTEKTILLKSLSIGLITLCSTFAYARLSNAPSLKTQQPRHYIAVNLGVSFAQFPDSTPTITYYNNLLTDRYPLRSGKTGGAPVIGLEFGYRFSGHGWHPTILAGLGLYSIVNPFVVHGTVNETPLGGSTFTLYEYRFNVKNYARAMAEVQFSWLWAHRFTPFIDLGVGPAFNKLYSYQEKTATPNGFVAAPPFRENSSINLAYELGFGIGTLFGHHKTENIALGFRYLDLGSVSFGTRGSSYPYRLHLGRLMTKEVYLRYTHSF